MRSGSSPFAAPNPLRGVAADAAAAHQHFMEERAGARSTIEIPGAAHAISVSHPEAVAHEVLGAAALRAAA